MRRGAVTNLYLSLMTYANHSIYHYQIYTLEKAEFSLKSEFEKMGINVNEPTISLGIITRCISFIAWLMFHRPQIVHSHLSKANFIGPFSSFMSRIPIRIVTHHTIKSGYSFFHQKCHLHDQ